MEQLAQVNIGEKFGSPWGTTQGAGKLVSMIVEGGIAVAGVIALFMFVFGGIKMIAGAGSSDPKSAAAAKTAVTMGIVGFIIVVTAFFVIQVIEIVTGINFITAPSFK